MISQIGGHLCFCLQIECTYMYMEAYCSIERGQSDSFGPSFLSFLVFSEIGRH